MSTKNGAFSFFNGVRVVGSQHWTIDQNDLDSNLSFSKNLPRKFDDAGWWEMNGGKIRIITKCSCIFYYLIMVVEQVWASSSDSCKSFITALQFQLNADTLAKTTTCRRQLLPLIFKIFSFGLVSNERFKGKSFGRKVVHQQKQRQQQQRQRQQQRLLQQQLHQQQLQQQ